MKFRSLFCLALSVFLLISCDNEDIDDNLLLAPGEPINLILNDSELYNLLENVTEEDSEYTCIQFVYPFTVGVFDENNEEVSQEFVNGDAEFFLLMDNLEEGFSIGVSFPITSVLEDGTSFEVNTLDELQDAIAECRAEWQEAIVGQASDVVQECVWEVAIPDDQIFSTYIDAVFAAANGGGINFFHRGIEYNGSWIIFFIEDELHLNINLNDQDEIGLDWNFDWKVDSYTSNIIALSNDDGDLFILNRECVPGEFCTTFNFQECEIEDQAGFADFDLASYTDCIIIMGAPQPEIDEITGELPPPIDWEVMYYESEADAQLAVNPLNTMLPYLNTVNNQELFVRIVDPTTQSFTIITITLEAIFCE